MTVPEFNPQPSTAFSVSLGPQQPEPTGPDHAASEALGGPEIPKTNRLKPPRVTSSTVNGRAVKEKPTGLGLNKQPASGIPKLNKSHTEQIASLYTWAGMAASPVSMRLAKALATGADDCANAWTEWANSNDKVRRRMLAILEGGAATKVFIAHTPILVAAFPPEFVTKMLARFGMAPAEEDKGEE